jgi:hypothetical protein
MFLGLQDPDPSPFVWIRHYFYGSFHQQAKTNILSLKTDVNVPSKSNKQKKVEKELMFVGILKATDEEAGSGAGSGS